VPPLRGHKLGKNVRKARLDLGLTQADLAERLDIDESTVRAIEAERRGVSLSMLLELAAVLRTRVGVLVGEERERISSLQGEAGKLLDDLDRSWQHAAVRILRELHDQVVGSARRNPRKTVDRS